MKKSKAPQTKEKPFSATPFRALKGVRVETPPSSPARQPAPPPEPITAGPDEEALFRRAMAGVKQLGAVEARHPGRPKPPAPRRIDEEERRVFLSALERLHLDVTFTDALGDDVEPLRPMPVNRMRQLRRGAIRIDYELDLHGLDREDAVESLTAFISGAFKRGQKAVLVITGKGNNSPGEPVLQGAVVGWLRNRGKEMVAEFSPAPRQMGGGGAFVVFLKEIKEEENR